MRRRPRSGRAQRTRSGLLGSSFLLLIRMTAAMRILVTGAAGYIGSALARALAARGLEVVATDQSAPAPVIGNLAYPPFARSLVTAEIGAVFHLAALVSG